MGLHSGKGKQVFDIAVAVQMNGRARAKSATVDPSRLPSGRRRMRVRYYALDTGAFTAIWAQVPKLAVSLGPSWHVSLPELRLPHS